MEYPVRLEWTGCNLGGRRAWFLCPAQGYGRRVAILFRGSIFACRHCHKTANVPDSYKLKMAGSVINKKGLMQSEELALKAGDIQPPDFSKGQRRAMDYVVSNGKRTGFEFGAALVADSIIQSFTSSMENALAVPRFNGYAPQSVAIHHNHPVGDSLSVKDFSVLLSRDELGSVAVHGHQGFFAEAVSIGLLAPDVAATVSLSARSQAMAALADAYKAGEVTLDEANSGLWQVVMATVNSP
jgi:hypothetical protein